MTRKNRNKPSKYCGEQDSIREESEKGVEKDHSTRDGGKRMLMSALGCHTC